MIERTFQTLDRLEAPDIRRDIDRRRKSEGELRPIPEPHGNGRRVTTALVALAVFAAAAGFGLRAWTRHHEAQPVADPWAWVGQGWTRIADPPERFAGASWVWAGDHLIEWGGCTGDSECSPTNEGFSYDPRTRSWTPITEAPRPGHDAVTVSEGNHAYFFGEGGTGQVFDAAGNTWTELADTPIQPDLAVWTGSEIVALQGAGSSDRETAAASYDPRSDTWRSLPPPPIAFNVGTITWSGEDVIVLGGLLNDRNVPASPTVQAMALDPTTGEWRTLPDTALYPGSFASAWVGDRLIAWDYETDWQSLDPVAGRWTSTQKLPLRFDECYVQGATVGNAAFAWNCGQAALLEGETWTEVKGGPLDEKVYSDAYERGIKLWRFADLVPAGDVLALPLTAITLGPSGEACYGCPGSPESLWVYRPPTGATSSSESPSEAIWPGIGTGLTALPAPPHVLASSTQVWTGHELVVWGGNKQFGDPPHFNEGYAFDASTLQWQDLPPSPLEGRSWATGVWDGREVLIGATGHSSDDGIRSDGAAYDPQAHTWRMLPPAPISGTAVVGSVWTGREMVVIGRAGSAAYTPSTDAWRTVADPPVSFDDASVVWTGREIIVLGVAGHEAASGAVYDPDENTWREIPAPRLPDRGIVPSTGVDAATSDAAWVGARLVVSDSNRRAATYDPTADTWTSLPSLPVNSCEGYPEVAASTRDALVQICGEIVRLSPGEDRWRVVSGSGEYPMGGTSLVSVGDIVLFVPYPSQADRYQMYAYLPPAGESDVRRAWDVAAAFGALRADYPFQSVSVPPGIQDEIDSLVSADARAVWEDASSGLGPFWAYYPGFEVRSVEQAPDGGFEAHVRFTKYSGSDAYDELLTIAAGTGLDGSPHDLVIADAKPG